MHNRYPALLAAVLLAVMVAAPAVSDDVPPPDKLLITEANRILQYLEPFVGENEVPAIEDVPVAREAVSARTQEDDIIQELLAVLDLDVDGPEPDCVPGSNAASGASTNAYLGQTHTSTVAISWCWHEPNAVTGELGYYGSFQVAAAKVNAYSPIVHYLPPDTHHIDGGGGASHVAGDVSVHWCTGMVFQGEQVCVDRPNHDFIILETAPGKPRIEFAR